ncbi:MAG: DUF899 domain-containing protein [Solirubrobacteraceae bacterium MAG38_C4-C5]|nr:DUF899 domain-containing protein [Candidatus Siliceabacter maunaloa]
MSLPKITSRDEWLKARKDLLAREKELTRARDALSADRRRLPMVEIDTEYRFAGPDGEVGLLDLFEGRRQLMVGHFMFDPAWERGCASCSAGADEIAEGTLEHLHARDTSFAYVSRAPIEKIERYKAEKGWTFPWYSSHGSQFNYDFGVTVDESVALVAYNYKTLAEHQQAGTAYYFDAEYPIEQPGSSCFLRDGDRVFHTYSSFGRGAEWFGGSYALLDLTALGRQEDWEEPEGRAAAARAAIPDFAA